MEEDGSDARSRPTSSTLLQIHEQQQQQQHPRGNEEENDVGDDDDDGVEEELEREGAVLLQQHWPTVDAGLGVFQQEQIVKQARAFFVAGFFLLPWLWFVNCFYFWPVLRHRRRYAESQVRPYVLWSGVGFLLYTTLLLSWALTFSIGGEKVLGPIWRQLAIYEIAEKYGLTGN